MNCFTQSRVSVCGRCCVKISRPCRARILLCCFPCRWNRPLFRLRTAQTMPYLGQCGAIATGGDMPHRPLGAGGTQCELYVLWQSMIAGAGLIAGVPSRYAQACDDDRYPCPVREQAVQETANAPAKPAPQPKKKVNHTRANEEASAKREAAAPANVSKPAMQEQAMQKAVEAGLAALAAAPADDESRGESLVKTAATAWPVSPNSEGAGGATAANVVEAASNPAQLIDPKQSNDLNRVAAASSSRHRPPYGYDTWLQRGSLRRCRPHPEGTRGTGRKPLDVDTWRSGTTKIERRPTATRPTREAAMAAFAKTWRRE